MRLVTRSNFDGIACGALLKEAGIVDNWKFEHPKDIQDGLMDISDNDCLANIPYVEGCGLWFGQLSDNAGGTSLPKNFKGEGRVAPSCARIIYDYYGGADKFPNFGEMMEVVDRFDSGNLTIEEIQNPTGWVLLGFIMDPRTGLGRWRNFTISNYQLMEFLIDACRTMNIEHILDLADVKERIEVYTKQMELFKRMVIVHTRVEGDVIITDLRGVHPIYTGNRFMIYSMFPEQNLSVWIVPGRGDVGCSVSVGYSILNKTATIHIGILMAKYKGGGRKSAGACQFSDTLAQKLLPKLIRELTRPKKQRSL